LPGPSGPIACSLEATSAVRMVATTHSRRRISLDFSRNSA
jgi:hypothetical protein